MVGFDVKLEILVKAIVTQEADDGGAVVVILVLGRFLWLGFDVEIAGEADAATIVDGEAHQAGQVVELEAHVGVEDGFVAFTATPKDITGAAKFDSQFEGFLDLGRCKGEDVAIGRGASAARVAGIGEAIGRAPEQFLVVFFL